MTETEANIMDQWLELRAQKQLIIDDLRAAIRYTPNRETDLLAYMRLYLKEDAERRPEILKQLRACMDGEPYPSPYRLPYTPEDVDRCDRLLTGFLDALADCGADQADEQTDRLIAALDELNEARGYGLLDDWRQRKLCALIRGAQALAGPAPEMR